MKNLIIAEKPSLARAIVLAIGSMQKNDGYYENDKYVVSYALGHLLSLYDIDDYFGRSQTSWNLDELPYIPQSFKYKITTPKDAEKAKGIKKQFEILGELIRRKDIKLIYNAGDPDREGCLIIRNLLKAHSYKGEVKRLWLTDQTEKLIKAELDLMRDDKEYDNMYNEGLCRTYLDWELGINFTRLISIKKNHRFPVGRVLIPIVKLIYDRDMAINKFEPEIYYTLISKNEKEGIIYKLELREPSFKLDEMEEGKKLGAELNNSKAYVKSVKEKDIIKRPGKLFSLSAAQIFISKSLKIPFAKSLKVIQSLYEKGYITYPRTDSQFLTDNEKGKAKEVIEKLSEIGFPVKFSDKDTVFDTSKVEGHSALTPTNKIPEDKDISEDEKLVYEVIRNRFIINFLEEETIMSITEIIIVLGEYEFKLKGEVIKKIGFYKYEPIKERSNLLPNLTEGEAIKVDFKLTEKQTTAPKHITDDMLATYLENPFRKANSTEDEDFKALVEGLQIGTQATRTSIIENAKNYGYIKQTKNIFTIEKDGIILMETLDLLKINLYASKTVEFSKILKRVEKGTMDLSSSMKIIEKEIKDIFLTSKDIKVEKMENSKAVKEAIGLCPRCKKRIFESEKSFYCEGYKNESDKCSFTIWKEDKFFTDKGKKLTKKMVSDFLTKGKTKAKGLKKKEGNDTYDATILMVDTGKYVNFKNQFR